MQHHALLQTKLFVPPSRPELVSRPRLIEQLNAGLHRKLTLVSAPAGFGKTTLLSEWVAASDEPIAWVSLDGADNEPARFLAYVVAALQTISLSQLDGPKPDIGVGALSGLQSPQPPPIESVLTSLINQITALPERIVLILDDYHLIEAQPVHDALSFLLDHLPPQMHLVISTRSDPFFPLSRLRARNQLTELRATDLRFSSAEAADFLNQVMGLGLSEEDIAALEVRTEGWITGLQLAAISLRGHKDAASLIKSFAGSHRLVLDYLVEEVMEQQSEGVQSFLVQTAILDRLTGSLCDAVRFGSARPPVGQGDGQVILEMLDRANLFIVPLDNERRWYRYHHLCSDLLRQRLRRTQAEWVPTLHRRASEWYEQNGFVNGAIEHALRAEDFERAGHLIEKTVDAVWQRGELTRLRRWLAGLPAELVNSSPHLCILHAWNLFTSGQLDAAERALDLCTDRGDETSPLAQEGQLSDADRMQIRGRAAAIRAFLASYRGDVQAISGHALQALRYLPERDCAWRSTATLALGDAYSFVGETAAALQVRLEAVEASRAAGNIYMTLIASMKLAVTMRQQGQLVRVLEICQQQLQLAEESGISQTVVAGWLLAIWGEVLAELNDLDGATRQATRGVLLTESGQDLGMLGWSNLCLMRVLFSRGDIAGASKIIQKIESVARRHDVPPWITNQVAAWQARIWLAQGKLAAASSWARGGLEAAGDPPQYLRETEYMALARILLAEGRLDEATRLLVRLLEAAEAGERTSRAIEVLILQALAFQARSDTAHSMATLERALALAEPGGFVRIFVDEGPAMARLLYEAATRGIAPDYARRLLAAFPLPEPEQAGPPKTQPTQPELIEPLSERELEVLHLIGEGLANREIATRLFLSLNTIKAHTRNIYGKLDVHSRTQAVAKARALGLLPAT